MPVAPKKRKNGQLKGLFRKIAVSARRELVPFGTVFVYPPENFDERRLGTIFGIIKISDTSEESSFIANLLASVIKKEYFSKPSRPAPDSFEASFRKANLALAELARQGSVKWMGRISFAGGALEKNNLHFSKLGTSSILLLRSGMIADISAGMGEVSMDSDSHPLKTFTDISSGKIENGDCLIFTTSDLLEIFSLEEIRQNAARFPREEFPDILSASLTSNSELSGAIVVNIVPVEDAEQTIEEVRKSYIFEEPPAHRVSYPAEKIAPSHIHSRAIPDIKSGKNLYISESDDVIPKKSLGEKIFFLAREFFAQIKNILSLVLKKAGYLFSRIDRRKITGAMKSIVSAIVYGIRKIDWRKKNVRISAAAAVLVALVIFFSLLIRNTNRKNVTSSQPAPPPDQTTSTATAPGDVNIKNIENISEVASLPADSREFALMDGSLYTLTGDKSILKINPASGEVEKIDSSVAAGKFQLAAEMPDLNTIFILTADKKVISFTPSNKKFQENNISFPDNFSAADMKTYLTYIYFLDSNAGQIYRYPRAEGGFGDRQNWMKAGSDVKNSTSFAINEDLFASNRNQLTAYLQGKKDEKINFENPAVPFVIDKIFTTPDLENIYILDNKNHRIIAFSKDGKIIAQYWNSSVSGIRDFTVDEKNKIIYLLKADSVMKFSTE